MDAGGAVPIVELSIEENNAMHALEKALENLNGGGELVLDFAAVQRIDPRALMALERLASAASDARTRLVLRRVNVDVYKVLKLVKLAPRLSFLP